MAKIWGTKFDIISPVWLQIVRLKNGDYEMNGEHDVDAGWMKDVRKAAHHKNKSKTGKCSYPSKNRKKVFSYFQSFQEFCSKNSVIRIFPSF